MSDSDKNFGHFICLNLKRYMALYMVIYSLLFSKDQSLFFQWNLITELASGVNLSLRGTYFFGRDKP